MPTVNIHEAKTHLSRLIKAVQSGETVVIAKAGRPVARLTGIEAVSAPRRIGFLAGRESIPDDFDAMDAAGLTAMFHGTRGSVDAAAPEHRPT